MTIEQTNKIATMVALVAGLGLVAISFAIVPTYYEPQQTNATTTP